MEIPSIADWEAAIVRASPAHFAIIGSRGRWRKAKHLDLLNDKLLALADGRIRRLIVTMPPRHGKSVLCSQFFPAWYLATHPHNRIILCSYEAEFAASWGGKARDLLTEYGKLFDISVREDARARNDWKIVGHEGGMVTAGVGGAITGRGANILVIDDPVKNSEQAASRVYREKTWDWWQSTAYTRLEPDASVLVIQTRWHEDDLAGRLLNEEKDPEESPDEKWELLNLPAIAEENDAMGRAPGEALWPERWPAAKLEKRKRRFGNYFWFALYQQRPLPPGGEIFTRDKFRTYQTSDPLHGPGTIYRLQRTEGKSWGVRADECRRFVTVDVAATENQSSDYSVAQVWAMTPGYDLLLLDQWRDQVQIPAVVSNVIRISRQWDVEFAAVEKNGVGIAVLQTLRQKGMHVQSLNAQHDKVMRAQAAQLRFDAEMIHFPESHPGLAVLIEELETFPKSAHDDTVDALTWSSIVAHRLGGAIRDTSDDKHEAEQDEKLKPSNHPGASLPRPDPNFPPVPESKLPDDAWLNEEAVV